MLPPAMAETPEQDPEKAQKATEPEAADRKAPRLTRAELARDGVSRLGESPYVVAAALNDVDPNKRISVAEASKLVAAFLAHEVEVEQEA